MLCPGPQHHPQPQQLHPSGPAPQAKETHQIMYEILLRHPTGRELTSHSFVNSFTIVFLSLRFFLKVQSEFSVQSTTKMFFQRTIIKLSMDQAEVLYLQSVCVKTKLIQQVANDT